MQPILHPNDAPDEIRLRLASWSHEIFMFESVNPQTDARTDGQTDGQTDGRRLESHPKSSP